MEKLKKIQSLQQNLASIINNHGMSLPLGTWFSEKDRWQELLICMINQIKQVPNIGDIREVIDIWEKLNLTSPAILSGINSNDNEYNFLLMTLYQYDFDKVEAKSAVNAAIALAKTVTDQYQGKIQTVIRKHSEALRYELTQTFQNVGLDSAQINYAVIHWLQNTTNAPLSLAHKAVIAFCEENEVDPSELVQAADNLDINLSIIDDVLERIEGNNYLEINSDIKSKNLNS